jgi:exodeoxyribonuclease-3
VLRVYSWNVAGLRAAEKKGFSAWLGRSKGDIVGVQEVRAFEAQLAPELVAPKGYRSHFVPAKRPGYSGVGLYAKRPFDEIVIGVGEDRFDDEGRFHALRFGRLWIANVYFPNGKGKDRDNSRVPHKLEFYERALQRLRALGSERSPMLVIGDFNTAHRPIDLANPKANEKISGFLPEERAVLDRWLGGEWVDTLRVFDPSPGRYSWWTLRGDCRARNVGWRIDYVLASRAAAPFLAGGFVCADVMGSDHCPVGVDLDPAVLSG